MIDKTEAGLRATIEELMNAGVSANLKALDRIYHNDLKIMFLGIDGQLMMVDKPNCLTMLVETFKDKNPEDHKWAKYHEVSVSGDRGHVLISRKIPLGGPKMMIDLSIDLVFEDDRWQVIREVNFGRPDTQAA
jgi:hypothetical protein